MRILHCTESLDPAAGGPARSVPQLALAQARLGHEVALWSPQPGPASLPDLDGQAISLPRHSGAIAEILSQQGSWDIVHDHGLWLPFHREIAKACVVRSIPRVVSPRGMLEPWAMNHKKWKKKLAWWLYQKHLLATAAGLHATADSEAAHIRALGFCNPMVVAANGVSIGNADSLPNSINQEPRTKMPAGQGLINQEPRSRTALFLSRVHPKKGLPMLLEAWAKVRPTGWRLRVVGPDEGGHRSELEAMVACAGLGGVWSFDGALEGAAKWQAYGEAELFILPTYSENFGIAVAEALACGVPVVTTTGAPWAGLVEHQCGWWVAPEMDAIAAALAEATRLPPEVLAGMGVRGKAWVERDFTWPPIAEKLIGFYETMNP